MTPGVGEKVAIAGGALLAAGLVTALLLYAWPKGGEETPAVDRGRRVVKEGPEKREMPPERKPARDRSDQELEIFRLEREIEKRDRTIERLQKLLERADVEGDAGPGDPALLAEELIRDLALCGPKTPSRDIRDIRNRITLLGPQAVPAVKGHLEAGKDVLFTDSWYYEDRERRFSSYPSLRTALIDALFRIGAEGQRALVDLLPRTRDPIEICQLLGLLHGLEGEPGLVEARHDAARSYVSLAPPNREGLVVARVLETIVELEPGEAATALDSFVRHEKRGDAEAGMGFRMLRELPVEIATETMLRVALDTEIDPDRALTAAEHLVGTPGPGVAKSLEKLLVGRRGQGDMARIVYRSLDEPVRDGLDSAEELAKRTSFGLEALGAFERAENDLAERTELLEARGEVEEKAPTVSVLGSTLVRLKLLAERAAKIRQRFEGE